MSRSRIQLLGGLMLIALGIGIRQAWREHQRSIRQRGQMVFREEVSPMLRQACWRCHGAENQKGMLRLDSLEGLLKGGASGPALIPGEPERSLILTRAMHNDPLREVPPKDPPSAADLDALRRWIVDGAPWVERKEKPDAAVAAEARRQARQAAENIGPAISDKRNPIVALFGGKRLDLWSLQPIANPKPPAVKTANWPRNDLDRFILAKIEASGQQPAPAIDARSFVRRLYFDLTGLPPTPEQLAAALAEKPDPSLPAPLSHVRPHVIDTLLDSREYAEHWATWWLDIARYSDSNGFDYDEFRPTAWRYRDYVVASLKADKPYDRFVTEQLAGDEGFDGPPRTVAEQESLAATGFLRIGPYDNSASKFGERDRCRAQVMSDLVESTAAVFLGLNFNCCRCHDHKSDPFAQTDYYRLRAFFEASRPNDDLTLDLKPQADHLQQEALAIDRAKQAIRDIENPAFNRLRNARAAKLPAEQHALLAKAASLDREDSRSLSEFTREQVRLIKKSIEPTLDEALATLSSSETSARDQALANLTKLEAQRTPASSGFLVTDSTTNLLNTFVLFQGDFAKPKQKVEVGVPAVFNPRPMPPAKVARQNSTGRRTALAGWLIDPSNPLTARVIVNRVWQAYFGTGIVASTNDFGYSGRRPSHPELLDWLAQRFRADGWSLKKLHRLILTSATYQQGLGTGQSQSRDGAPLFNSRPPRRLTAEALRDSLLAVSGLLQPRQGGPPIWPELPREVLLTSPSALMDLPGSYRGWYTSPHQDSFVRSLYLVHKRSLHLPLLEAFDLPDSNISCAARNVSTVAPQALTLLNSQFIQEAAQAFAQRLRREVGTGSPSSQIQRAFLLALQRPPDADEASHCAAFEHIHGLPELCRAVLNLNEFAYVD